MPFHATGFSGERAQHLAVRVERLRESFRAAERAARGSSRAFTNSGRCASAAPKTPSDSSAAASVVQRDAEVVLRDRVRGFCLERATIARLGVGEAAFLVQRDAALVPELGAVRLPAEEIVVQRQRFAGLAHQQVHLRHRLQHEIAILAAIESDAVLAHRLGVVSLAAERETEVVVRELPLDRHLQLALGRRAVAAGPLLLDREVRVRARQRRIELDRAARRRLRVLVASDVAEHEAHQIQRVVILRVELDRPLERAQRFVVQPAVIENLAERELQQRAVGVERERALDALLRALDVAGLLFGERELQQRGDVVRGVLQQRAKLLGGLVLLAEQRERPPELPARVAIFGTLPQALAQLRDARVVVAGIEVRDLEVALRDLHRLVELERLHERGDRLLVQALVVVQNAEVVVRARVRRIDPPGERAQNLAVALRRRGADGNMITRRGPP